MQDGWGWMFTEGIQHGSVCQLAAVACAEPPANNLPGLDIEDDSQVVPSPKELEVGEVLYLSPDIGHGLVAHAILGASFISELRILSKDIRRWHYLCCSWS